MNSSKSSKVLLLFSGGIDSTACIQYYLDLDYSVTPLFIKFNQQSEKHEFNSAKKICNHYELNLHEVKVVSETEYKSGEIIGRNLMLVANALINVRDNDIIALGIHYGTGYYDCSETFIISVNHIFAESTNGTVRIDTPFLKWSKKQIWDYCKLKKVPIDLTYSCEVGGKVRCGKCATCQDLNILYGE